MHTLADALTKAGIRVQNENPAHRQEIGPCRKRAYADEAHARIALARLLARPDCIRPETLIVYTCWNCGAWHTGHDARAKITLPDAAHPPIRTGDQ